MIKHFKRTKFKLFPGTQIVYVRLLLLFIFIIFDTVFVTHALGIEYFVSPAGNDISGTGDYDNPWKTIQNGVSHLKSGDILYIRGGTYYENVKVAVSGEINRPVIISGYKDEIVVLDGSKSSPWEPVVLLEGVSNIELKNMNIRNNPSGWGILVQHREGNTTSRVSNIIIENISVSGTGAEGIQIRGRVNNILIQNSVVHDTGNYSGIDIYQWDGGRPERVTVRGCKVYNSTGFAGIASEQADFLVIENNESYSNSLGIDIGSGDYNIIRNNRVYNCATGIALSSNENSEVYDNVVHDITDEAFYSYYWALHGEAHIGNKWYRNRVFRVGFGIFESDRKPGYEGGISKGHVYRNNIFYQVGTHGSYRPPFYFSGVREIKFINNTLVLNQGYEGPSFKNGASGAYVVNNIIYLDGNQNGITIDQSSLINSYIDYNCYFNKMGAITGPGPHSLFTDPLFLDPSASNFHLRENSPVIDSGIYSEFIPAKDIEGTGRCDAPGADNRGGGSIPFVDIGGYEFPCGKQIPAPPSNLKIK